MKNKSIKIFRWTLRVFSGILILFFLIMFIGETFFSPESLNSAPLSANAIIQLAIFGIIMLGLGLAWKWELTGGLIALVAYVAMAIISPRILEFPILFLYPATGILFIMLWVISRNAIKRIIK